MTLSALGSPRQRKLRTAERHMEGVLRGAVPLRNTEGTRSGGGSCGVPIPRRAAYPLTNSLAYLKDREVFLVCLKHRPVTETRNSGQREPGG